MRLVGAVLFIVALSVNAAEPFYDGPYIEQNEQGRWIARWVEGTNALSVREEPVAIGDEIVVPSVGSLPAFTVELRETSRVSPDVVKLDAGTPLFVVADTHGEFEIAAELLRRHEVIDDALRWSFGEGHLAILGDVFDRGARQTELLWFLYKLEAEAERAGGRVHLLLGNHEAMVLLGDDRYLNPRYARTARALNAPRYAALWNSRALLGRWLRSKAAAMKIGEYLCAHGGISPEAVDRELTLETINSTIRDALRAHESLPQGRATLLRFVTGPAGPLWYRGYFSDMRNRGGPPRASDQDIARILDFYDARAILVGHTKVPTITPLYEHKVIAVQVYPHRNPNTGAAVMEALLIENDRFFKAGVDGSVEAL